MLIISELIFCHVVRSFLHDVSANEANATTTKEINNFFIILILSLYLDCNLEQIYK